MRISATARSLPLLLEQPRQLLNAGMMVEMFAHSLLGSVAKPMAQCRIADRPFHCRRQRLWVLRRYDKAVLRRP